MALRLDTSIPARPISTPPLNRKYLRAFHDYQPAQPTLSGTTGGVSVTVPLTEGDIILVHLTHANGWADGTVLQTGARGWIPTNFCQAFDHPFIRSLMHSLTQLWDYLSSEGGGKAMVDERQDYVQGLIAGVRRLLEHCDCLHRDDALIQKHIALRRTRKSLLAELSSLIQCRKQIQDTFSDQGTPDVSWSTIDDYMAKAFKIVCRGVRFLDLWIQRAAPARLRIVSSDQSVEPAFPSSTTASFSPTSPVRLRTTFGEDTRSSADSTEAKTQPDLSDRPNSSHDSQYSRMSRPCSAGSVAKRQSLLYSRGSEIPLTTSPPSETRGTSLMLGLRPDHSSLGFRLEDQTTSSYASEQLSAAHDHLLGHIGAFLGLHLQSRTSLDLASATERSLEACTSLIAIIEEIWSNDPNRSEEVSDAITNLWEHLGKLADAAQKLCKTSNPLEDPAILKPDQGKLLVIAATACVRSAGDCTAKARQLLDQNGDIELDLNSINRMQLAVSSPSEIEHENLAGSEINISEKDPRVTEQQIEVVVPYSERSLHMRSATAGADDLSAFVLTPEPTKRPASSPEPLALQVDTSCIPPPALTSPHTSLTPNSSMRDESLGLSVAESASTYQTSFKYSPGSARSPTSTRATTPDKVCHPQRLDPALLNSFSSFSSMRSAATAGSEESEGEAEILARSYAHELLYNKGGHILGGTLRALVEKLTNQHSPPDPTFVSTFYLTFRLFTKSIDLARALVDRFEYVGESKTESMPARLRVYNFMKGWLESHWLSANDSEALDTIKTFATEHLKPTLPAPGQRLVELVEKASQQNITSTATQIVNPMGKNSVSMAIQNDKDSMPNAVITKNQLNMLRLVQSNPSSGSILDFDFMEIARQFTLVQSRTFCAIEAEELLNLNWTKNASASPNIRAMARFATDLANLVADTILSAEEVKKRALVVRQWIRIGKACLDLNNYDCVMAIVCSLTSSTIVRLRATWEQVPAKWKLLFDELKGVVDVSRNYAILRQRLQATHVPCLPFIGIYLTDLTFVDAGNQDTRILPSSDDTVQPVEVINFDKHLRTARIIAQLQHYQIPYRLQPIVELQSWLEGQMTNVRVSEHCSMQAFWRRSLKLEPKVTDTDVDIRPGTSGGGAGGSFRLGHKVSKSGLNGMFSREKLDFLSTLGFKSEGELKAKIAGAV